MEQLKHMKECLTAQVQAQMGNLQSVDAKELGEAVDMIKDLAEAIYYCTITEAMDKQGKEDTYAQSYYTEMRHDPYMYGDNYYRDMDRSDYGRMYYSSGSNASNGSSSSGNSGSMSGSRMNYTEREYPMEMRDKREGKSPLMRKAYMESKEMHKDKTQQMKDLEMYVQELASDITEMVKDASPEEKVLLQKKISTLANKIE